MPRSLATSTMGRTADMRTPWLMPCSRPGKPRRPRGAPGKPPLFPLQSRAVANCWFCGKVGAGGESVAYPFDARSGDGVRVVVVPRCDACAQVHRTQMLPSGVILLG